MPVRGKLGAGDPMQVICIDGTVLQCERFEAIDSGVLLFGESRRSEAGETEDEEETEPNEEANAFVPLHQLRFVLPEGIQPGAPASQALARQPAQRGPARAPPSAPQQGQVTHQQPGGQPSQTPPGTNQQPPQPGPGRQ